MTNRFGGKCAECGEYVASGKGRAHKGPTDTRWRVSHIICPPDEDEWQYDACRAALAAEDEAKAANEELTRKYLLDPQGTLTGVLTDYYYASDNHPRTMDYLQESITWGHAMSVAREKFRLLTGQDMTKAVLLDLIGYDEAVRVGETDRSAWYDTTTYRLPARGFGEGIVRRILSEEVFPPQHNYFGGYCSLGRVHANEDGTIDYQSVYHIGN